MSKHSKLRLGTRSSPLAMWQSHWVKDQLLQLGADVELVQIRTEGDDRSQPLVQIGGQGVFTKRLQIALLENKIDLAVHSLKDLPTEDHPDLKIAAVPQREVRFDAIVARQPVSLKSLSPGAVIGTGSVRRAAQLLHLRPDLKIKDIRGNVDTRLRKLDEGEYDAIVLAAAGLTRLGLNDRISYLFDSDELLPAVGQGALGLETRADDPAVTQLVERLNHPASYFSAMAERSMLKRLFAGCLAPVGADTIVEAGRLCLHGAVLSPDGQHKVIADQTGDLADGVEIGIEVAETLLKKGAGQYLQTV